MSPDQPFRKTVVGLRSNCLFRNTLAIYHLLKDILGSHEILISSVCFSRYDRSDPLLVVALDGPPRSRNVSQHHRENEPPI
jgi:hypothetical protein